MRKLLFAATILFMGCNTTPSEPVESTDSTVVVKDTTINTLDTSFVDTIKIVD